MKNSAKLSVEKQKIPRHKEKFAALNFKRQVKLRKDAFDGIEEYVDKLNDKEKAWLNSFLEETVVTNFKHKGKKFYKTKKAKREMYTENNARNRCMFTKAKAMNSLFSTDSLPNLDLIFSGDANDQVGNEEDAMLSALELKRSGAIEQELLDGQAELAARALELKNPKLLKRKNKARKTRKRNS